MRLPAISTRAAGAEETAMDDATRHEGDSRIPGSDVGDQVGLGRVVEDRRHATGSPDADDPPTSGGQVEEASEDSFPASDPPGFMSDSATPTREIHDSEEPIELPAPRDVP
jgi:hypothetical protein